MPELPEAENICRALKNALCGKMICKVEIFSPAMRTPLTPLVDAALEKHFIIDIRRRGRYLVAELDGGSSMIRALNLLKYNFRIPGNHDFDTSQSAFAAQCPPW